MSMSCLAERIPIVDTDSHVSEPPDLWTSRMPARWADTAPHIEVDDRGVEVWVVGDTALGGAWRNSLAGWRDYLPSVPTRQADVDPAAYDATARLAKLDDYGIWAQVLYPNILAFNPTAILSAGDAAFHLACVRAYNDFLVDFAAADPRRLVPIMVLPFWDVQASVAEIWRAAALGHRGILFANRPDMAGLPALRSSHWNPVYRTAQEAGLSINFHIGFGAAESLNSPRGAKPPRAQPPVTPAENGGGDEATPADPVAVFRRGFVKRTALGLMSNAEAIVEVITSGLCERFPNLNFVSVESGVGYVPYLLDATDWQWLNSGAATSHPGWLMPSEYFTRQVYATFWFEDRTARFAAEVMPDNMMFESDFPHPTCLAPGPVSHTDTPRRVVERHFASLAPDVAEKILFSTAARVYRLERP